MDNSLCDGRSGIKSRRGRRDHGSGSWIRLGERFKREIVEVEVIKNGRTGIKVYVVILNQDGQGGAIVLNLISQSRGKTGSSAEGAKLVLNTGARVDVAESKRVDNRRDSGKVSGTGGDGGNLSGKLVIEDGHTQGSKVRPGIIQEEGVDVIKRVGIAVVEVSTGSRTIEAIHELEVDGGDRIKRAVEGVRRRSCHRG